MAPITTAELTQALEDEGIFAYAKPEAIPELRTALINGDVWALYREECGLCYQADAEFLAEFGIKEYLEELRPALIARGVADFTITEEYNPEELEYYRVIINGQTIPIWDAQHINADEDSSAAETESSWYRATVLTARILNDLLDTAFPESPLSGPGIYAVNGGNDLCFIFLTPVQSALLKKFPKAQENPNSIPYALHEEGDALLPPQETLRTKLAWLIFRVRIYCIAKGFPLSIVAFWALLLGGLIFLATDHQPSPQPTASHHSHPQPIATNTTVTLPQEAMLTLTIDANGTLTRSGGMPEQFRALVWHIEMDGVTVLERGAENETSYRYYRNEPGHHYRVFLRGGWNGAYHTVSNVIEYQL